jgi:transmembrane sensor
MTPDTQRIDTEAAEWAVRMSLRPFAMDEQAELDQWLAVNERHRGALLRARAAWSDVDRLAALTGRPSAEPSAATQEKPVRQHFWRSAAAVAAILLVGAVWSLWPADKRYATPIGGLNNVLLADGSHVTLNTDTRIRVVLRDHERRIELDKGEALFQVAKDPSRPFVVRAGSVSVRAIGTAFSVRTLDHRIDVTVTEGLVELTEDGAGAGPLIRRIAANERASVIEKHQVEVQKLAQEEAQRQIAWRTGTADFAGGSLAEAVAEINRHNVRQIVIDDPALAHRPVVGVFRANDSEGFAATVATALDAEHIDRSDAIHLRPRAEP